MGIFAGNRINVTFMRSESQYIYSCWGHRITVRRLQVATIGASMHRAMKVNGSSLGLRRAMRCSTALRFLGRWFPIVHTQRNVHGPMHHVCLGPAAVDDRCSSRATCKTGDAHASPTQHCICLGSIPGIVVPRDELSGNLD